MIRPVPSDYGLCSDFNVPAYKQYREEELALARSRMRIAVYAVIYPLVSACSYWIWSNDTSLNGTFGADLGTLWAAFLVAGVLSVIALDCLPGTQAERFFHARLDIDADEFVHALEAWENFSAETGLGFWREKRGVEFEKALIRMFATRGCKAQGTKGSGDGGVDLILRASGTFWCQCKGHAKPISVGPIREIAGVCSRNGARPAVFAVNGYTRAARETAAELGVLLFDSPDIVNLARSDQIRRLKGGFVNDNIGRAS